MNIRTQANDAQFNQWAGYMSILQSGNRVANFPPIVRIESNYDDVVTYPLYDLDEEDSETKALQAFFEAERFMESNDAFWLDDPTEEDELLIYRLQNCKADDLTEEELITGLDFMRVLDYSFYNREIIDDNEQVIKREKCVAYTKWD